VVLTTAVIEDVLLYVALAVALGFAQGGTSEGFGLLALLPVRLSSAWLIVYHVGTTIGFLVGALALGPHLYSRLATSSLNLVRRSDPLAFELAFLFACVCACLALGVTPFFGALIAATVSSRSTAHDRASAQAIKRFSFAFFVPLYFALVGLRLDLGRAFSLWVFLAFLGFACAVKGSSVYAGARLAGHSRLAATDFAVALNARGGPGIVLASVAYEASIIDQGFYAVLVMTALITSALAGGWLHSAVARGRLVGPASEFSFEDAPEPIPALSSSARP
jgi:Kef-type K+ transport system membrane component KefB